MGHVDLVIFTIISGPAFGLIRLDINPSSASNLVFQAIPPNQPLRQAYDRWALPPLHGAFTAGPTLDQLTVTPSSSKKPPSCRSSGAAKRGGFPQNYLDPENSTSVPRNRRRSSPVNLKVLLEAYQQIADSAAAASAKNHVPEPAPGNCFTMVDT